MILQENKCNGEFQRKTGRKYQYGNVTCDIYYLSLHFQKINQPLQDDHDTLCLYLAVVNNLDIIIMSPVSSVIGVKQRKTISNIGA